MVMKMDPDVKMIPADGELVFFLIYDKFQTISNGFFVLVKLPILLFKACEIFISKITSRTFIISDSNKRRTLSRSDIAAALSKSDQFDFLLDIVPRDIGGMTKREIGDGSNQGVGGGAGPSGFNGGAASGVGKATAEGLESLQVFDEEGRNVDGRRMVNRSGDVLEESFLVLTVVIFQQLELLLEKPHGLPGAGSSDVVRLSWLPKLRKFRYDGSWDEVDI
ncbi:hypothetical protein K435DRAFT_841805 [Dendrothele bispora CBS 962.96]|uniref:Transcription factor CBF/NF-Y/archaeal histone domain-containing protein n=1 Tax=Dendrothele bispora (strain CBS 962.96) TaxID=1314807 RepID=A0A4S8LLC1_DENBC|nr:hypothetical protein K435DRAFT_841805 [Dendrothele bispora CBS 962.96]